MTTDLCQEAVLAWLATPGAYPGHPDEVERLDTHSASVFLAGAHAYKVKRAVRYPFLDFSTLDRRRAACEAEVRLNRRTAKGLYCGVSAVTREGLGALAFDGRGVPVEWVVVMRRFPQAALLDAMCQAGTLEVATIREVARGVAALHADAATCRERGGAAAMRAVADDNAAALRAGVPPLDGTAVAGLVEDTERALDAVAPILDGRRVSGRVRQCHGDLHLRNIVMLRGVPTLFDAVEFNDDFAQIDVWYDTAFLIMDLLARGRAEHANAAFNEYLRASDDWGALRALPLFLSLRAAIRGKTSLASAALAASDPDRAPLRSRAGEYVSLARRLLVPAPLQLIAVGGLSGTGKSTLAEALAPLIGRAPGAVLLRTDLLRKQRAGVAAGTRLPDSAYTAGARSGVYQWMADLMTVALDAGTSVVVDATFLDRSTRAALATTAAARGAAFAGLWLEAPEAQLIARLEGRRGDASDATPAVLPEQHDRLEVPADWVRVDASGSPSHTLAAARAALERPPR